METVNAVKSFLDSANYEDKHCSCFNWKSGQNPFVTISRQAGAGGNTLANTLIAELATESDPLFQGWQKFNEELCYKIADEPGLQVTLEQLIKYEYRSEIEDMVTQIIVGDSPQDVVNKKMFQLVRTLATVGKAVLVGRGGVCLTRDLPLGVHIHLVAPLKVRINRMSDSLKLTEKKAREWVLEQDKSRARLIKTFFDKNIDDPLLYDAVWNTAAVSMKDIAHSLVALIQAKACHCIAGRGK